MSLIIAMYAHLKILFSGCMFSTDKIYVFTKRKKRARELPIQLTKDTYGLHYCTENQYCFDNGTITTITNTCE